MKITEVLLDARTEWSFRWTALLAITYALFFFPPSNRIAPWIDWSLPVQLVSGGNLGFYNAGFHVWFGIGAAAAMVVAGCFLAIIFPLLQENQLGAAYVILLSMLTVATTPVALYVGVLNNLTSIAILLIVIFTEVFYGPVLNLRNVLPDQESIFTEVVRGNAVPAIIYVGFSLGVYAFPPWHSGTQQSFSLVSSVLSGIGQVLEEAAKTLENLVVQETSNDDEQTRKWQSTLRTLASTLFQQANSAGLEIPITLYGDMGLYEISPLFPNSSLPKNVPQQLGSVLDETSFHVSIVVWSLGSDELLKVLSCDAILCKAVVEYLQTASKLVQATAALLQYPRRSYKNKECCDWRNIVKINTLRWFGVSKESVMRDNDVRQQVDAALTACRDAATKLQTAAQDCAVSSLEGSMVWAILRDLSTGEGELSFKRHEMSTYETTNDVGSYGSLGRMMSVALHVQTSWNRGGWWTGLVFQLYRMSFLAQIQTLATSWVQGFKRLVRLNFFQSSPPFLRRRGVRRGVQYLVGTWGLYAMATWWDSYRTLLGNSSTGQWTMVAFYACFRSTCEETVNAAILRSIGHGLGGLLSWGINTAVETSGSRMAVHLAINLVFTWLIPPPFVYPSSIQLGVIDKWLGEGGVLEGCLTTYHLTSVLVFSTDIESAAKARSLSQCLGAAAAAVVSLLVLPWYARVESTKTLNSFKQHIQERMGSLGKAQPSSTNKESLLASSTNNIEELLQARRDWLGAVDSKGWFVSLLDALRISSYHDKDDDVLTDQLARYAIAGYALEGLCKRSHGALAGKLTGIVDDEEAWWITLRETLATGKYNDALEFLRQTISNTTTKDSLVQDELATVCMLLIVVRDCNLQLKNDSAPSSDSEPHKVEKS